MFLAIDGLDGSGKSSAAASVAEALRARGLEVEVREHPGPGFWGRACRRMLLREGGAAVALSAAFLFLDMACTAPAARRSRKGGVLIAVRYDLSAYFLRPGAASTVHALFSALMPMPDLEVVVDVEPEVALARVSARGEEQEAFENRESMDRVRKAMLAVPGITVVDGGGSPEETVEGIMAAVGPMLPEVTV